MGSKRYDNLQNATVKINADRRIPTAHRYREIFTRVRLLTRILFSNLISRFTVNIDIGHPVHTVGRPVVVRIV